jgi:hypothetical protein
MRDNVSKLGTLVNALGAAVNKTTVAAGTTVDLANFNAATLYIMTGTWTDGTHTFLVEEAPDAAGVPGSWTTVATTDLVAWKATSATDHTPVKVGNAQPTAISSAATAFNQRVGYIGAQRFIRCDVTASGSTGAAYDAVWIEGEPRNMPSVV